MIINHVFLVWYLCFYLISYHSFTTNILVYLTLLVKKVNLWVLLLCYISLVKLVKSGQFCEKNIKGVSKLN